MEVRFHGRGGQGTVVASEILANAFFRAGKCVQAFPSFGVERRGAPVAAFLRVADHPILVRCQIESPDHVVILDPTLLASVDVCAGVRRGGWIVINSPHPPDHFRGLVSNELSVATVDASGIARRYGLGNRTHPIVNSAILGAFAAATRTIDPAHVLAAIREGVPAAPEENARAALAAFEETRGVEEVLRP
ncbi:MAG: pyruvate/ketoisovalerate ferredoxin oxidoreductase subunit gamma [Acidobacteriota bacterium]